MAVDRLLLRYTLLAARVEQLLLEPALEGVEVPDEAVQLLDDAAYRLGLYVSAMPGARAPAPADFEALAGEIDEAVTNAAVRHEAVTDETVNDEALND